MLSFYIIISNCAMCVKFSRVDSSWMIQTLPPHKRRSTSDEQSSSSDALGLDDDSLMRDLGIFREHGRTATSKGEHYAVVCLDLPKEFESKAVLGLAIRMNSLQLHLWLALHSKFSKDVGSWKTFDEDDFSRPAGLCKSGLLHLARRLS